MNIFSNKFINFFSLIISIIIFFIINFFINNFNNKNLNSENITQINQENIFQENNITENKIEENNKNNQEYNWYIEIESISLHAPIKESTEIDVLEKYIGHFENTSLTTGNIGLAGHNEGYENNYFENLNKIKKGDLIKYKYNDFLKEYIVDEIEIIRNTDWSYLEEKKENKITLITCILGKPNYRLCVQATEK